MTTPPATPIIAAYTLRKTLLLIHPLTQLLFVSDFSRMMTFGRRHYSLEDISHSKKYFVCTLIRIYLSEYLRISFFSLHIGLPSFVYHTN